MISISINVDKIRKERLVQGKMGRYLNVVLFETPDNKYGDDFVVKESLSREERERGDKAQILGNGKYIGGGKSTAPPVRRSPSTTQPSPGGDSVPF